MRYTEIITESGAAEVNLAHRLKSKLSREAQYAIDSWESHNWINGDLSTAYSQKNAVYQEIERAAETLRKQIRQREGDTIVLYRGIKDTAMNPERHSNRAIYSWTTRPKIAAVFADLANMQSRSNIKLHRERPHPFEPFANITDQQAQQVQNLISQGKVARLGSFIFKRWPDDPRWTRVYRKTARGIREYEYSVESDGIVRWVKSRRDDVEKDRARQREKPDGFVVRQEISVDDIVWVLNASGSMEYVVRGQSGLDGERIEI